MTDRPASRTPRAALRIGRRSIATLAFVGLGVASAAIYLVLWAIDFSGDADAPNLIAIWSSPAAAATLANFGEVMVGVLGIALTVVAILVQLAGYRYTPRITDLFVRDVVNMGAIGFFVVTTVLVIWVNMTLPYVPEGSVMIFALVAALSLSVLGLLPYFAYIFAFLTPRHIVGLIQAEATTALHTVAQRGQPAIRRARRELMSSVEHLDDMAQNAVKKDDKAMATRALSALFKVLEHSAATKERLPERWFETAELAVYDADFVALQGGMIARLQERRIWVEMKILRGMEFAYRQALGRLPDINHLIATFVRRFTTLSADAGSPHAVELGLRYFNTLVRHAINASDMRSAYNVLNAYREAAVHLVEAQWNAEATTIAERLKYYAHLAFQRNQSFLVETIAQDVSELLERAHGVSAGCHDALLETFLEIDREPFLDLEQQEASLRGVRKAQVRLATFYLDKGAEPYARRIFEDMRAELPERLRSIWHELATLDDPEWWEIANRDINWDYLPPARRARLDTFFGWFDPPLRREAVTEKECAAF